jgi:hypothetical protein
MSLYVTNSMHPTLLCKNHFALIRISPSTSGIVCLDFLRSSFYITIVHNLRFATEEILFLHSCTVGLKDLARISLVIIVDFLDLLRCLLLRILHAVLKLCE